MISKAKILALILIFILSIINISIVSLAAGVPTLTVASVDSHIGAEVDISVSISDNPGIATFNLKVNFDKTKLEPMSITKNETLAGNLTSNINQGGDLSNLNYITAYWVNPSNINTNGILYTVRFKVKSSVVGNIPLTLTYSVGDISNQVFDDVNPLIINGGINVPVVEKVVAPIANPIGGMLTNGSNVQLSSITDGTSIYYTTNGSNPTINDTLYLEPIVITEVTTIKAIAVKNGMNNSDVSIFDYGVVPTNSTILTASMIYGNVGDEVDVPITIGNNSGIATFSLKVNFDQTKLEPISITKNVILSGNLMSNIEQVEDLSNINYVTAYWVNATNFTANGEIFKIRFRIREEFNRVTPIELTYTSGDICDQNFVDVISATVTGGITNVPTENETKIISNTLIKSENIISGNIVVGVTSKTNVASSDVLIALYEKTTNKLIGVLTKSGALSIGTNNLDFSNISFNNIIASQCVLKVFTWNLLNTMKPINNIVTVDVQ
jgi:hypothetical protein